MADEAQTPEVNETPDETQEDNLPKNTVEVEEAGTLKKKVIVTVHRDRIDAKRNELFGELSDSAQIPGFRPGHAPRRLIEKRFGKDVDQDVRNSLIGEAIGDAIEDAELKTLGEPDIKLDDIKLPEEGDMTFDFEVEIQPEFDLPETKGIEVNKEIFEVDNDKIDEYINNIKEGRARYEKTDDASQEGDTVIVSAKITGEGVTFENPRVVLRVAAGLVEGVPIVELGTELAGKKVGDVVTLKATPAETHPNEDWREKELTFELTVHEVSKRILPEINEEFATSSGFDSLQDFRDFIANQLKSRVEMEIQNSLRKQICQYLMDKADFELPEGAVKSQTHSTLQRQLIQLLQAGIPREKIDENLAKLQAAASEQAKNDLKLSFILNKIADEADLNVTEGEVNSRVAQMAAQYGKRPERLRQELAADGSLQQIAVSIREEKAIDKLLEDAKIIEVKPEDKPKAEEEKKPAKKAAKKTEKKADEKSAEKAEEKPEKKTAKKKAAKKSPKKTEE